jgi:hypothetical protein
MPVLRAVVIAVGVAMLGGGVIAAFAGAPFGAVAWLLVAGTALVVGVLFERGRYKPNELREPGPGWVATDERFTDPQTGEAVTVYYRPSTGERRYVGR